MSTVTLIGGHFDGDTIEVDPHAHLKSLVWKEDEAHYSEGYGIDVYAVTTYSDTYERVDEHTFQLCRTPGGIGDDPSTDRHQPLDATTPQGGER